MKSMIRFACKSPGTPATCLRLRNSMIVALIVSLLPLAGSSFLIHDAVEKGDLERAEALLKKRPGRANQNDRGKRPLFIAAEKGDIEMAKLLIKYGADVNHTEIKNYEVVTKGKAKRRRLSLKITPVDKAATANRREMAEYLISQGGEITFSAAILLEDVESAGKIIENDPSIIENPYIRFEVKPAKPILPDMRDSYPFGYYCTPLQMAVKLGDIEMVKLLIERGTVLNKHSLAGTALHIAVKGDDLEMARLLIDSGADISKAYYFRNELSQLSPLHQAAINGNVEMVQFLLSRDADPNSQGFYGLTPLREAAMRRHDEAVEILADQKGGKTFHDMAFLGELGEIRAVMLQDDEMANSRDENQMTPLHAAAMNGQTEMIIELIEHGADPEAIDRFRLTPMVYAARYGHLDAVRMLLKAGVDPDGPSREKRDKSGRRQSSLEPIRKAIQRGHLEVIKTLVEAGAKLDSTRYGCSTVLHAANSGKMEIMKYLLELGADPNTRGFSGGHSPLSLAIEWKDLDMVKLLLEHGADPNGEDRRDRVPDGYDRRLLNLAIGLDQTAIVKEMIRHGAEIGPNRSGGKGPLHRAIEKGNRDIVKLLLDNGYPVTVDQRTRSGPLEVAAQKGDVEIIRLLLKKGASPHSERVLSRALTGGNIEAMEFLIENGAAAEGPQGGRALLDASRAGARHMVEFLLSKGADPNYPGHKGAKPLHYAAQKGRLDIIRMLLEKGARADAKDSHGRTPVQLATEAGHYDAVVLMLREGSGSGLLSLISALPLCLFPAEALENLVLMDGYARVYAHFRTEEGATPLHTAVRAGEIDKVDLLLRHDADVDAVNSSQRTPLHYAVESNRIDLVRLLVEGGADLDVQNSKGQAPLTMAVAAGRTEIVQYLSAKEPEKEKAEMFRVLKSAVENGETEIARVLLKNNPGISGPEYLDQLLPTVVRNGDESVLRLLLGVGADPDYIDKYGNPVLITALENMNIKIAKILVTHGADVNVRYSLVNFSEAAYRLEDQQYASRVSERWRIRSERDRIGESPLHSVSRMDEVELARLLIEKGAELETRDYGGATPLEVAAGNGSYETAKLLLASGAEARTTVDRETLLHVAAKSGNVRLVQLLLGHGFEINARNVRGETPLHVALLTGKTEAAMLLIRQGADINAPNQRKETPLHYAVRFANQTVMNQLIKSKCSINARDELGKTPLYYAVEGKDYHIVSALLKGRANPNYSDGQGSTPLHEAVRNCYTEIAVLLMNCGTRINARDKTGSTPLHLAAARGRRGIVELLIKRNARVNKKNKDGETPLHIAARKGDVEIVEMLVSARAKISARNSEGSTPLHVAAAAGRVEAVRLLLKKNADPGIRNKRGQKPSDLAANDDVAVLLSEFEVDR